MFHLKGFCAGIVVFKSDVEETELDEYLQEVKEKLKKGTLTIIFGLNTQTITEICVDVFEKDGMKYRPDLSVAFKK